MSNFLPHPPPGGEVAARSDDGVGDERSRSRRKAGTTARARSLRRGDNQAEALLWLELKNSKLGGYKFTRQLPIGPYFADFCCRKQKLVIEVDGSQHAGNERDEKRDAFILAEGYHILRFWNHDVLKKRGEVCDTILVALTRQLASRVNAVDLQFKTQPHQSS